MSEADLFRDANKLFEKVCKIYNKTEDEVNEDIEVIKRWFQTQPHLPEIMKDSHIRNFLILNKFSIENTKEKIDMYYTIRSLIPDLFEDCNPKSPRLQKLMKYGVAGVHPHLWKGKYRIYIAKIKKSFKIFLPEESILVTCNAAEVRLHEDCFLDDVILIDAKHLKLSELAKVTPCVVAKARAIYEKVYSLRLRAAYVYNAPAYIAKVIPLLQKMLKPKIFQRIHICENEEILKDIFTIDTLPKDYGGNGPSLQELTYLTLRKFDEYQERFDDLDKMRVDETLRPKLANNDAFGFYGNFKKLSVD